MLVRSSRLRFGIAGFIFGAILLAASASASAQTPAGFRLQERIWLPCEPDAATLGLFHLDQHRDLVGDQVIDEVDDEVSNKPLKAPKLMVGPGSERKSQELASGRTRDASPQPRAARMLGKTSWVAKGLYGGSLRLESRDAVLATPDYPYLRTGGGFTVEAWFQPEKNSEGVMISLPAISAKTATIEVRRNADGDAQLYFDGKPIANVIGKVPAETWTHVALLIYPARGVPDRYAFLSKLAPPQIVLQINTRVVGTFEDARVAQSLAMLSSQAFFGNNQEQTAGLACVIDEARVSQVARYFYPLLLSDVRTPADRAIPTGPPLLREAASEMFATAFENDIAAARAVNAELASPMGVVGDLTLKPDPVTKVAKTLMPTFVDGPHGRSMFIGPQFPSVKYSPTAETPVIDLQRGSIEFWFSPLDWDNRQRQGYFKLLESVPLLRSVPAAGEKEPAYLAISAIRMQPYLEVGPRPLYLNPGTWYHLIVTWDEWTTAVFINGRQAPASIISVDRRPPKTKAGATTASLLIGALNPQTDPQGHTSIVDEVRTYRRALMVEEAANLYGRFLPEPRVTPLPYMKIMSWLSTPMKQLNVTTSLLAGDPAVVRSVRVTALHETKDEVVLGPFTALLNELGSVDASFSNPEIPYGKVRIRAEYLTADGKVAYTDLRALENPRPAWLSNTLGVHEGKVLPGWSEMTVADGIVGLSQRNIAISPSGWPMQFTAVGEDVLARPLVVRTRSDSGELAWKPTNDAVTVEHAKADRVVTHGEATAGDWKMSTRVTTEFDGLMKIETTLTPGKPGATLTEFVVEVPVKSEHSAYYGFWSGNAAFRAAADYGPVPQNLGIFFTSNKHHRAVNPDIVGSFVPFVVLAGDKCGLNWFAENDQGWTKTRERSSIELQREDRATTLRLRIIQAPTQINEPLKITFGLHLSPVKPMPANRRSIAEKADFGFVEAFSKQPLKSDFPRLYSMGLMPDGDDWDAVVERAKRNANEYKIYPGYKGPILYIDRNYVGVPASAGNFTPIWARSGVMRYLPDSRDMNIWCMNEWIKRKLIAGIYIDDAWGQPMKDPETGPAYKLADGHVQPGFEFYDYNTYMRRLRWLFHDNGVDPLIWVHATQTFYLPIVSYADLVLDGEDRFPAQGAAGDFFTSWGLARLQFNQPEKWGFVTNWMFKAGGPGGVVAPQFRHWKFRQFRAYQAGCMLHDLIVANSRPSGGTRAGIFDDAAKFIGYWQANLPVVSDDKDILTSVYVSKNANGKPRVGLVIVNMSDKAKLASLKIDLEKLGVLGGKPKVIDTDEMGMPEGEDPTQIVWPRSMTDATIFKKSTTEEFFDQLMTDITKPDPSRGDGGWATDRNFRFDAATLQARVRARDYRLMVIDP